MIGLLGYNFLLDGNSLDPSPTTIKNVDEVKISNAEFDELELTKDVLSPFTTDMPTEWTNDSIMQATFQGNLVAGNVLATLDTLTSIRIKRREFGTFNWLTIREVMVNTVEDIIFTFVDVTNKYNTDYEYAWVPVLNGAEGEYTIVGVHSIFRGTFIADMDSIYKFRAGVAYGQSQQVQQVGVFSPLNKKYPIYITNGALNYQTGSLSGTILGNYENTHILNRQEMVAQKDALLQFLVNKKAKIIKDDNGNIWMVCIIDNPTISYNPNWGNNMMNVNVSYSEVGDIDNEDDRRNVGFVPTI